MSEKVNLFELEKLIEKTFPNWKIKTKTTEILMWQTILPIQILIKPTPTQEEVFVLVKSNISSQCLRELIPELWEIIAGSEKWTTEMGKITRIIPRTSPSILQENNFKLVRIAIHKVSVLMEIVRPNRASINWLKKSS